MVHALEKGEVSQGMSRQIREVQVLISALPAYSASDRNTLVIVAPIPIQFANHYSAGHRLRDA